MKHLLLILAATGLVGLACPSHADCYADYKAKQNDPLRLHYGVAQINGTCSKKQAKSELSGRLQSDGWVLLNVLSVFDSSGLDGKKADAGQFFLRY
jgi:hypothetical protein